MRIAVLFIISVFAYPLWSIGQRTDSLLQIVSQGNRDIEEVKALNSLAADYMRTDLIKAKTYLFKAISLSKSLQNEVYQSSAYAQLVTAYHNSAHTDSAIHYLNILEKLAENVWRCTQRVCYAAAVQQYGSWRLALPARQQPPRVDLNQR